MTCGKFITFEGGEGAGKSTQVGRLVARLQPALGDRTVVRTREPGGSRGAEVIRNIVVATESEPWSAMTETLLMYAARSDHMENTILPALSKGDWVVCDRFADSSRAYQGVGGGVAPEFIEQIDAGVVGSNQPDLTLVFDLPAEVGLERAFGRGLFETRFESKGLDFHQRLREGFLNVAKSNPHRCIVIDAVGSMEEVEERVWRAVAERLL